MISYEEHFETIPQMIKESYNSCFFFPLYDFPTLFSCSPSASPYLLLVTGICSILLLLLCLYINSLPSVM